MQRSGKIRERLVELGEELPAPKPHVANYVGCKAAGDTLFVSARVSQKRGVLGDDLDIDAGKSAARSAMLDLLAIVEDEIGDLDRIVSIDKVVGFVHSADSFTEQPKVLDGASELLIDLWGEAGRHARSATGVAQTPFGAAVQIEMVVTLAGDIRAPRSDADDRAAVSALLHNYCTALDRRDWSLFSSIFESEIEMDFGSVGAEKVTSTPAEWTERARGLFERFGPTQHLTTNHSHTLGSDHVVLVAAMQAEHFPKDESSSARYTLGGFYTLGARLRDGSWRVGALKLEVTWRRGDRRAVMSRK